MSRRGSGTRPGPGAGSRRQDPEAGVATALSLWLTLALLTVLAALVLLAGAVTVTQRARTAADLAALAGAGELLRGGGDDQVCGVARQAAKRNEGEMAGCRVVSGSGPAPRVEVETRARVPRTGITLTVRAAASAVLSDEPALGPRP